MLAVVTKAVVLLAQAAPPPAPPPKQEESGNFLVSPNVGIMLWTLIAFGITLILLRRLAFPRIAAALDKRRIAIEESIEHAQRTRKEADELLTEYRERLKE